MRTSHFHALGTTHKARARMNNTPVPQFFSLASGETLRAEARNMQGCPRREASRGGWLRASVRGQIRGFDAFDVSAVESDGGPVAYSRMSCTSKARPRYRARFASAGIFRIHR